MNLALFLPGRGVKDCAQLPREFVVFRAIGREMIGPIRMRFRVLLRAWSHLFDGPVGNPRDIYIEFALQAGMVFLRERAGYQKQHGARPAMVIEPFIWDAPDPAPKKTCSVWPFMTGEFACDSLNLGPLLSTTRALFRTTEISVFILASAIAIEPNRLRKAIQWGAN
jgi:hypothetical protein